MTKTWAVTASAKWGRAVSTGLLCVALTGCAGPSSAGEPATTELPTPLQYQPYEFLVGDWDIGVEGSPPAAVTRFQWGPMKTYLWFSGSLLADGVEQPSYEGMLVWNGVRKNLDMLVTLDLSTGGLVQEHGQVSVESDGTVVRDIYVVYTEGEALPPNWDNTAGPDGASAHFRHSFTRVEPGTIRSTVMRETETGWVPSFPGSDRLVMTRRAGH